MSRFSIGTGILNFIVNQEPLRSGLASVESSVRGVQSRINNVGSLAMRALTLGGGAAAGSFMAAANFENQMAKVQTAANAGAGEMDMYRDAIRRMSTQYGQSTQDLSNGLFDIISAGFSGKQAVDILDHSIRAAIGGYSDLRTATRGITSAMLAFQVAPENVGQATDQMAEAARMGKLEFSDLADNIGKIAPLAYQAGVSFDTMLAAFSQLTQGGNSPEAAATQLSGFFKAFIRPSKQAVKAFQEIQKETGGLGFQLDHTAIQGESLFTTMDALSKLSVEQIGSIFPDIRGARAAFAFKTMAAELRKSHELLKVRSPGATQKMFEMVDKTGLQKFKEAKQSVIQLSVALGDALAPAIQEVMGKIISGVPAVIEWIKAHKDGISTFAKWFFSISLVLGVLPMLTRVLLGTVFGLRTFIQLLRMVVVTGQFVWAHPIWAFAIVTLSLLTAALIRYAAANETWQEATYGTLRSIGLFHSAIQNLQASLESLGESSQEVARMQAAFDKAVASGDLDKQDKAINDLIHAQEERIRVAKEAQKQEKNQAPDAGSPKTRAALGAATGFLSLIPQVRDAVDYLTSPTPEVKTGITDEFIKSQEDKLEKLKEQQKAINDKRQEGYMKPFKAFQQDMEGQLPNAITIPLKAKFVGVTELWEDMQKDLYSGGNPLSLNTKTTAENTKAVKDNTKVIMTAVDAVQRNFFGKTKPIVGK